MAWQVTKLLIQLVVCPLILREIVIRRKKLLIPSRPERMILKRVTKSLLMLTLLTLIELKHSALLLAVLTIIIALLVAPLKTFSTLAQRILYRATYLFESGRVTHKQITHGLMLTPRIPVLLAVIKDMISKQVYRTITLLRGARMTFAIFSSALTCLDPTPTPNEPGKHYQKR